MMMMMMMTVMMMTVMKEGRYEVKMEEKSECRIHVQKFVAGP